MVSCFKSEINLVSFSLTSTCIYFISNTQFQTVANFSRCLKSACHVHMQIYSLFYVNLMQNLNWMLWLHIGQNVKAVVSAQMSAKKVTFMLYVCRICREKVKYSSWYTLPGTLVNSLRVLSVPCVVFFCFWKIACQQCSRYFVSYHNKARVIKPQCVVFSEW